MPSNVIHISKSPGLYGVEDMAYQTSLSTSTIYRLIRSGRIPATKMNNRWVIARRRFHEWIDSLVEVECESLPEGKSNP